MNSQKNFEIILGNSRKFLSESILSYEHLINNICQLFCCNINDSIIEIFYIKDDELIIINNTETMQNMMIYDNTNNTNSNFVLKLNIQPLPKSNQIISTYNDKKYFKKDKEKDIFELVLFPEEKEINENDNINVKYEKFIYKEIKNIIMDINNSDIGSELYLQEFENLGSLKKLIDERLKMKVDAFKKLELERKQNDELDNNIIIKNECRKDRTVFYEKCISCLTYPIIDYKFICLFCEDSTLCNICESNHEHPCIKIKSNTLGISTLKKIIKPNDIKKGFFSNAKSLLFGTDRAQLKLFSENRSKVIYVKPDSQFNLDIFIENIGSIGVPKYGRLIPLNNKDLSFKNYLINTEIKEKKIAKAQFSCFIPNNICEYFISFVFVHEGMDVDCENLEINLKVSIDQQSYIDEFFKNDPMINDLKFTQEQKEKIFIVIKNDLSEKNSFQIANILSKHNWNISKSIDELSLNT